MKSKRGAEGVSMTGVLMAVVLLVIVAVVLIMAFTGRLGGLSDILGGGQGLSDSGRACQIACASADIPGFCTQTRTVKGVEEVTNEEVEETEGMDAIDTTGEEAEKKLVSKEGSKVKGVTCEELANNQLVSACTNADLICP